MEEENRLDKLEMAKDGRAKVGEAAKKGKAARKEAEESSCCRSEET